MNAIAKYNGYGNVEPWMQGAVYCLVIEEYFFGVRISCADNDGVEWFRNMADFHVFWKNLSYNK